jgi:putative transposase
MQHLGRLYVHYFNYAYSRTGTLFEGRFRSCLVQSREYLLTCLRYIELNPVRAGIVGDPGERRWSSYQTHGFGMEAKMWTPHRDDISLGDSSTARQRAYRGLMSDLLDIDVVAKIRHCTNTGLILGTENFGKQVAVLTD